MIRKAASKANVLLLLRWIISVFFFFLGISKVQLLQYKGFAPFEYFAEVAGFPEWFKYYGVIALLIEFFLAIGLWVKPLYKTGLFLGICLSFLGVILSIYSIYMRVATACSCGLLGHNETWLLFQKTLIIVVLGYLYKGKQLLFPVYR